MSTPYTVEAADLTQDPRDLLALWVHNLPGFDAANARAKLQLGYVSNPAREGQILLLLADDAQPQTQGAQGLHPRRFLLGAESLSVVALADLVVNAEHRSLGPALMLMRRSVEIGQANFDLTYGLPNERAAAVCTRAGLKRLAAVKRYAKPLASLEKLGQRIPPWMATFFAPLVDRALTARDSWRGNAFGVRLTCRSCSWNDPALDDVWAHRRGEWVVSERTSAMLRWRFDGSRLPQSSPRWDICVAHDVSSAVHGYVVWRQTGGFVEIGDFFVKDVSRHLGPMLLGFARFAKRHDAVSVSVEFLGDPQVGQALAAAGWHERPHEASVFIGAATPAALADPDLWFFTAFDNDAD